MTSLASHLDNPSEENVQRYLNAHQAILLRAFCRDAGATAAQSTACFPKFRFGAEYVSDFVIVMCGSFVSDVVLVELEPPTARPFNKFGTFAKRLNDAYKQVTDWLSWINENQAYFRAAIVKQLKRQSKSEFADTLEMKQFRILTSAKIVIGRRNMLSDADDKRRAELFAQTARKIEILPYDRLVDIEEEFEE